MTITDNTILYSWNLLREWNLNVTEIETNKLINVLISVIGRILSPYICISNHHSACFKYLKIWFNFSKAGEKIKNFKKYKRNTYTVGKNVN